MPRTIFIALLALALTPFAGAQSPDAAPGSPNPMTPHSDEGQPKAPDHFYRMTLRVLEFSAENKLTDTRTYIATMPIEVRHHGQTSIRSGDRVPSAPTGSFQYLDTGVKIDLENAEELGNSLQLNILADISTLSVLPPASSDRPIVRQLRWQSDVVLPIGKPTVIFSSDNASDHGRTELEGNAILIR